MSAPETIEAVAIEFEFFVWTLPRPARHHDVIAERKRRNGLTGSGRQGFVTNTGRFVDRGAAAHIAYCAGQIKEPKAQLFSEDVW